jgi:hypothetical protein
MQAGIRPAKKVAVLHLAPCTVGEAQITSGDGTARDKATRIVHLAAIRKQRVRAGPPGFELIACIDGRGFGVRKADMRRMLQYTRLRAFLPTPPPGK